MILGEDAHDLDAIDAELLDALQQDAKTSLAKLGEQVGLSAPAVMERVRKLEQAGVITGYHAQVDAKRIGLDITAFIGVSVRAKQLATVGEWAEDVPQILECHHVTGAHTVLLKVKVRNTRALEQLITRMRSLEGVKSTDTMVVFSTSVERIPVALDVPRDAPSKRRRPRRKAS